MLKAHEERDRLVAQVADKGIRLNKLGNEVAELESHLSTSQGRVEELEDELDEMQQELGARGEATAPGRSLALPRTKSLRLCTVNWR